MIEHRIRVHPSADRLARENQLAWKIAERAAARPSIDADAAEMAHCRVVDNASVALASVKRRPVVAHARPGARIHARAVGTLFGTGRGERVH